MAKYAAQVPDVSQLRMHLKKSAASRSRDSSKHLGLLDAQFVLQPLD